MISSNHQRNDGAKAGANNGIKYQYQLLPWISAMDRTEEQSVLQVNFVTDRGSDLVVQKDSESRGTVHGEREIRVEGAPRYVCIK